MLKSADCNPLQQREQEEREKQSRRVSSEPLTLRDMAKTFNEK